MHKLLKFIVNERITVFLVVFLTSYLFYQFAIPQLKCDFSLEKTVSVTELEIVSAKTMTFYFADRALNKRSSKSHFTEIQEQKRGSTIVSAFKQNLPLEFFFFLSLAILLSFVLIYLLFDSVVIAASILLSLLIMGIHFLGLASFASVSIDIYSLFAIIVLSIFSLFYMISICIDLTELMSDSISPEIIANSICKTFKDLGKNGFILIGVALSLLFVDFNSIYSFAELLIYGILTLFFFSLLLFPALLSLCPASTFSSLKSDKMLFYRLKNYFKQNYGLFSCKWTYFLLGVILFLSFVFSPNEWDNQSPEKWFKNEIFQGNNKIIIDLAIQNQESISAELLKKKISERLTEIINDNETKKPICKKMAEIKEGLSKYPDELPGTLFAEQFRKSIRTHQADLPLWVRGYFKENVESLERIFEELLFFRQPELLCYIDRMQKNLREIEAISKIESVIDIIKEETGKLPETPEDVGKVLVTWQKKQEKPRSLYCWLNPDYNRVKLRFHCRNNKYSTIKELDKKINEYLKKMPPPIKLKTQLFGIVYENYLRQKIASSKMLLCLWITVIASIIMTILFHPPVNIKKIFYLIFLLLVYCSLFCFFLSFTTLNTGSYLYLSFMLLVLITSFILPIKNTSKDPESFACISIIIGIILLPCLLSTLVPLIMIGIIGLTLMIVSGSQFFPTLFLCKSE
ncbi:MAG: hypothetical protein U9O87_09760 [Verrucomicrobiota bacterium]|nr:hypothetical protein [Verrucomicrobiota bacterium]